MTDSILKQLKRRKLLGFMTLLPWAAACGTIKHVEEATDNQHKRFKGIALVLVVDAVPGAEMEGVVIYDDRKYSIYTSGTTSRRVRTIMALGGNRVPLYVRAIWRHNAKAIWGSDGGIDFEGEIAGDYTIPVAERVPDEILNDLRAHRGNLRLKFRLKPGGILFGWDIERASPLGDVSVFQSPGGDFLETRY